MPISETKNIEYKTEFNSDSARDWCEIIKDIVAVSNTGGGEIYFGIESDGTLSKNLVKGLDKIDVAQIIDKISKYTAQYLPDIALKKIKKGDKEIYLIKISAANTLIVFIKPGTYPISDKEQRNAFSQGTVYFRHGAKSEPGNSKDIEEFIQRKIEKDRAILLSHIKTVVEAPSGYQIKALPPEIIESGAAEATPIRLVDDPSAPVFRKINIDETYPFRQKEVVEQLNRVLPEKDRIKSYDIQILRKKYNINNNSKFSFISKYSSRTYSKEFVEWLTKQYNEDNDFFRKAR